MLFAVVFMSVFLVLQLQYISVSSSEEKLPVTGQYVASDELESLRYRLYSELADNKNKIESLKNDLQYWKNETLNILKKYLASKDGDGFSESSNLLITIVKKLNKIESQTVQSDCCSNTTNEIVTVDELREVLDSYKKAQSQELREIISEMNSGQLPLGTFLNPATSCKHIPENSSSGNYWIQNAGTGYASLEYCDMDRRCCNSTGGWMRVAQLNMTDFTFHCPAVLRKITSPKRSCGRPGFGCHSIIYPVNGITYSRVCGRINAYQYYSPNGFYDYFYNRALTIDDMYVDGVSLTHGRSPRKHIWTFVNAIDETRSDRDVCPCTKSDSVYTGAIPPYVGNDYFCDTGSRYGFSDQFYFQDPLWDSNGCGSGSTCCQFNNPPWFCKQLTQPTTEDIELRLCAGQLNEEDIALEIIELFVQ